MRAIAFFVALTLCACGSPQQQPRNAIAIDPAIADALADPILVDPQLSEQANADVLRPADHPFSAPVPPGMPEAIGDQLPLAERATRATRARGHDFAGCDLAVRYGMGWAARLPEDMALPEGAQVIEAAGSDTPACRLRAVNYAMNATPQAVAAGWQEAGRVAGYAAMREGETLVLRRARDGAVARIDARAAAGGANVDVIVNRGS